MSNLMPEQPPVGWLSDALRKAVDAYKKLPPEAQAEHDRKHREAWALSIRTEKTHG